MAALHYHNLPLALYRYFKNLVRSCLVKKILYPLERIINVVTHVQKRLMLGNLKELYQEFKEKHPTDKIGFSKFADLRPKHCILAGASATHSYCLCLYHSPKC